MCSHSICFGILLASEAEPSPSSFRRILCTLSETVCISISNLYLLYVVILAVFQTSFLDIRLYLIHTSLRNEILSSSHHSLFENYYLLCSPNSTVLPTQQTHCFILAPLTIHFLFIFFDFNSLNIKINPFLAGCIAEMVTCISDVLH